MYLDPSEYAAYGIPDATDAQVETASRSIDAALGRPEGLLWMPDADGEPCYMAGMTASRAYTLQSPVTPGSTTTLTFPKSHFTAAQAGMVAILDRANVPEAVIISSASGSTLTLEGVNHSHDAGATLEFGLVISEQAEVRCDETFFVSRPPLARLLSFYGQARYPYQAFPYYGQLPRWSAFPLDQTDYDAATGDILLLEGTVYPAFSTARVQYVSGWSLPNIPPGIKQAVAALVTNAAALGAEGISGNIKLLKSGDATIERFAGAGGGSSLFDSTTMNLIAPYRIYRI